jgi:hypothetical protein
MISKKIVNMLAKKALQSGNPYIKSSIEYFIDRVPHYLFCGEDYTKQQLDRAYLETAERDIKNGYNQRMVGYYDKWYRYNHSDEGRAYDLGSQYAANDPKCSEEFIIIECLH